jgi:hypothetical protein
MANLRLKAEPVLGRIFEDVVNDAKRICIYFGIEIEIVFNGVKLIVRPTTDLKKLKEQYHKA